MPCLRGCGGGEKMIRLTACCPNNYGLPEHCFPPCSAAGDPRNVDVAARGYPAIKRLGLHSICELVLRHPPFGRVPGQRRLPFGPFLLVEWVPIPCSKSRLAKSSSGSGNHGEDYLGNRPRGQVKRQKTGTKCEDWGKDAKQSPRTLF